MDTINLEIVQCLLHTLVFKVGKLLGLTAGAWLFALLDFLQTSFAEVLATAGSLVGLSKDVETDGTLRHEDLGRWLHKITLKASHCCAQVC